MIREKNNAGESGIINYGRVWLLEKLPNITSRRQRVGGGRHRTQGLSYNTVSERAPGELERIPLASCSLCRMDLEKSWHSEPLRPLG